MPKKVIEDDLVSESSYGDMPLEEAIRGIIRDFKDLLTILSRD